MRLNLCRENLSVEMRIHAVAGQPLKHSPKISDLTKIDVSVIDLSDIIG